MKDLNIRRVENMKLRRNRSRKAAAEGVGKAGGASVIYRRPVLTQDHPPKLLVLFPFFFVLFFILTGIAKFGLDCYVLI